MNKNKKSQENNSLYIKIFLSILMVILIGLSSFKDFMGARSKIQPVLKFKEECLTRILFTPLSQESFYLIRLDTKSPWRLISNDLVYPIDEKILLSFIKSLIELKAVPFNSHEKANFTISALPFFSIYEGETVKDSFSLGERNTLKREIYIQRTSDEKIFLSPDIFSPLVNQGLNYFLDRRLFPCVKNQDLIMMKTIPLTKEAQELPVKETTTYTHTHKRWQSDQGKVPSSASFHSLNELNAIQILAEIPEKVLRRPHYKIELLWANNHREILTVYAGIDERLLVKLDSKPYAYLLDPASLLQFY